MTPDIMTALAVLILTVFLLAFDLLRIDVIALVCLLALGWTGVLTPSEALSGFASNAVIAMIAVMVMGRGGDPSPVHHSGCRHGSDGSRGIVNVRPHAGRKGDIRRRHGESRRSLAE